MKPIIITDSCSDLPDSYYAEMDIKRVRLTYTIGGESFFDNAVDAEIVEFYSKMRSGENPLTSQVNSQTFLNLFGELAELNRPIIYIGFSSKLSSTFSGAALAAETMREKSPGIKIAVIDSKCASMGQGQVVFYAARMRDEGKSFEEIVAWAEENIYRSHHWVCVDDLQYLKRGGRLSAAEAFFGSLLSIKPLIWVDTEGHLTPFAKERGRRKVLRAMADKLVENIENPDDQTVFICHSDDPEGARELREMITARIGIKDIRTVYLGVIIGAHVGPGTLAVFFMGKDRRK